MKRSLHLRLTLTAAVPLALTACDNPAITGHPAAALPSSCDTVEALRTPACEGELARLLADTPRFASKNECDAASGAECVEVNEGGRSEWIPPLLGLVGGMVLAEAIDEIGDAFERKHRRPYRDYRGARTGGGVDGRSDGYRTQPARSLPSRAVPERAIALSRGGFGSVSSARTSFGRGS